MKLNCLIIDDEPVARKGMEEYVKEIDFLNLVAKCENPLKASPFLADGNIDLLLLDIQMPRLSGIEFLKMLQNPPMVIFTTAFSEYALEGYSLNVIDYLMKPIPFDRFVKAVNKALDFYKLKHASTPGHEPAPYFFVKCDGKFERINVADVQFAESLQNYVVIHTADRKYITYITLSGLEEQLPKDYFVKVHKSYLVSLDKIKAVDGNELLLLSGARVPVSRNLKDDVMKRILGSNLLKR